MNHPYSQAATDCGQTEPDKAQEYLCFLCEGSFEVLEPTIIDGEAICPDCQLLSRKYLLALLVEEKTERIRLENQIRRIK